MNARQLSLLLFFVAGLLWASPALAVSSCGADWCRVDNGATNFSISVGYAANAGECRMVTNTTGTNLFIPARTVVEWNAFKAKVMAGLTIASCGCNLPWGGTISEGQNVTAYQTATVACAASCVSQTRTCTSGVLSGTYTNQSCSVGSCDCTGTPWGTMTTGTSNTAYSASSVACGGSCAAISQTRTCTNTVLSGSYTNTSCSASCANCVGTPWGTVAHGYSNTAYLTSSVSACSSCSGQARTCNNGTMSGTYANASCSVNAASCGDGCCTGGETCGSCPGDCGACIWCGDNICNGAETCGNCPGDCGACCTLDCAGVCNGGAVLDCAGVCNGGATRDCANVCGGGATLDCAGVCGGGATRDCANVCNGGAALDCAGVCNGGATPDCWGVCNGGSTLDCAGVCGGASSDCGCGCNRPCCSGACTELWC